MENQESKPYRPCPLCGGTDFVNGVVHTSYHPDPNGKFKGLFSFAELRNGETIWAMKCNSCGHLDMFAGHAPESPES